MFNHLDRLYIKLIMISFFAITSSQNLQDLQNLQSEYKKMQQQTKGSSVNNTNDMDLETSSDLPNRAEILLYKSNMLEDSTNFRKFFGYNFFTNRDTTNFWENLPAPANYLLGPGDELIVSLWGETQLRKTFIISREGKIFDDKVGILNLNGKTIEEGEKFLSKQFGRVYSTLDSRSPSTFIDISLGKLRSINVNFVGEVKFPGVYPIHPFSNVITGLIQSGGIDTTASLRNIKIKRKGQNDINIDLYNYLLKGNLPNNLQLRDQDVVLVPVREFTVHIDSSVVRPGIYEAKSGETVRQLINYAGGFKPKTSSRIGLKRISSFKSAENGNLGFENFYIDYKDSEMIYVKNGDKITPQPLVESINQVEIIGRVLRPGIYYHYKGMKLKELIDLSGGFSDTTFWKSVYQDEANLVRRDPDAPYESVIPVNLVKLIIENDEKENFELQNLDRFVVRANRNFYKKENVIILGEVNMPGSYPIISDNESLNSIIGRSGGFTPKALKNGISIYRNKRFLDNITFERNVVNLDDEIANNFWQANEENNNKVRVGWENDNILLMPGDSIIVQESSGTVNILGAVYNPGLVEYRKGKSLRYYLNSAGGLSQIANKKGIVVVYGNGTVRPKKWYISPPIEDGSTIIVNKKELTDPFNLTQFATNWTSIISSVVTIVLLSKQL